MSSPDSRDPGTLHDDGSDPREENLFGKLDQLISKHQGRIQRQRSDTQIPVLTEPVEAGAIPADPTIPILQEVVPSPPLGARDPASEKRRKLQIALYLRLRQRLDDELQVALAAQGALAGTISDAALTRLVNALRSALPTIVGESVDQVLAADAAATRPSPGSEGPKL
jgi:hypothetical protein